MSSLHLPTHIVLTEAEVPGAFLEQDLSKYKVAQLRRWLVCRGKPTKGVLAVLKAR